MSHPVQDVTAASSSAQPVSLLRRYHRVVDRLKRISSVAWMLRVSIALSLIASIAIVIPVQTQEALRVVGEDLRYNWGALFSLLAAAVFFGIVSWYWARVLLYVMRPQVIGSVDVQGYAARIIPRLCASSPVAAAGLALIRAARPLAAAGGTSGLDEVQSPASDVMYALGFATIILSIVLYVGLHKRGRWIRRPALPAVGSRVHMRDLPRATHIGMWLSAAPGFALLFWFVAAGTQVARFFGPAAIVFLGLSVWIPVGSYLVYTTRRTRIPLITVMAVLAIAFSWLDWNDNHRVRYDAGADPVAIPEFNAAFDQWLANRADRGDYSAYPVFLVAAEGGGLRAAYQTALVMGVLQDLCPRFAQHTFAISGVSGGSVGAAIFATLAQQSARNQPNLPCDLSIASPGAIQQKVKAAIRRDYLSPALAALLYPDMLQRFLPVPIGSFDRARALEHGFEAQVPGMSQSFHALWQDASGRNIFASGAVPALLLNTTRVETGERMVISSLRPSHRHFSAMSSLAAVDPAATLPLSAAAVLSARFPGVTPSGHIIQANDGAKLRFVDGGYFENSGAATLHDALLAMASSTQAFEPIVLRIGFSTEPVEPGANNRARKAGEGLNEIMSPVRTLLNTRSARGITALRQLEGALADTMNFIDFEFREKGVPLPLGWQLSNAALLDMDRQLAGSMGLRRVLDKLVPKP